MALQEFFESPGRSAEWSFEDLARDLENEELDDEAGASVYANIEWQESPSWGSLQNEPEWSDRSRLDEVFSTWSAGSPLFATEAEESFLSPGWSSSDDLPTVRTFSDEHEFPLPYVAPRDDTHGEQNLISTSTTDATGVGADDFIVFVDDEAVDTTMRSEKSTPPANGELAPIVDISRFAGHRVPSAPPSPRSSWLSLEQPPVDSISHEGNQPSPLTTPVLAAETVGSPTIPSPGPVHPSPAEPVATTPVAEPVATTPVAEPVATTPVAEPVAATPVAEPVATGRVMTGQPHDPWLALLGDGERRPAPELPVLQSGLVASSPLPEFGPPPAASGMAPPAAASAPLPASPLLPPPYPNYPGFAGAYAYPVPYPQAYALPQSAYPPVAHQAYPMPIPPVFAFPPFGYATPPPPDMPPMQSLLPDAAPIATAIAGAEDLTHEGSNGTGCREISPRTPETTEAAPVAVEGEEESPYDAALRVDDPVGTAETLVDDPVGTAETLVDDPVGTAETLVDDPVGTAEATVQDVPLDDPFIVISSSTYMVEFANPFTVTVDEAGDVIGDEPWGQNASPLPQLYAMVAGQVRLTGDNTVELLAGQIEIPEPEIYGWAHSSKLDDQTESGISVGDEPMRINGWTVVSASNDILPAQTEGSQKRKRRGR